MVQGHFRSYSGGVRRVPAFPTVALYHVLREVFLADGDDPFFTVAGEIHAEDSRHIAHFGHIESVHQLLLELIEQSLAGSQSRMSST